MLQSAMFARPFLLILPWMALAPSAHAQTTGPRVAFHLRMVQVDPNAEAAITSYLTPATAQDGISVVPLPAGVSPSDLIRLAGAAGKIEILTETNVLSGEGREASFLAGSTFPFPVVAPGSDHVASIEYRPFGIRLDLFPTAAAAGTRVQVASEVSLLDYKQAVTVLGFTVPGLSRRRNVTQMDLAAGQGFAISGLVDGDMVKAFAKLPPVVDAPLVRAMANSGGTKVLVLVTPEIQGR